MALAPFFSRISDALTPFFGADVDLQAVLADKRVLLSAPAELEKFPLHLAGFVLATNLCARLYPRMSILAPTRVFEQCAELAAQINPLCEVDRFADQPDAELAWATVPGAVAPRRPPTRITPSGWSAVLNSSDAERIHPTNMLTSLAAAALGAGELFRQVFAKYIVNSESAPGSGSFNLLTHAEANPDLPDLPVEIDLGRVHLVGAGAIGQAALYALARVGARGTVFVIDPEFVTLSNLQRYVLASTSDVNTAKCTIAARALQGSALTVVSIQQPWGLDLEDYSPLETVCVAVDSAETRVAVQASLPRRVFNAWTQPADLGWSRHEQFGITPCLACLYWPTGPHPHYYELIADSLKLEPLRVLAYLANRLSPDSVLQKEQIPVLRGMPIPSNAAAWSKRSILDDLAQARGVAAETLSAWRGKPLSSLYHEGICGGALVRRIGDTIPSDVAVPLAHQSVLAGIMLALQVVVANVTQLARLRPRMTEGRLDLLSPLPQLAPRPRERTPGCLCFDTDFVSRYQAKWA